MKAFSWQYLNFYNWGWGCGHGLELRDRNRFCFVSASLWFFVVLASAIPPKSTSSYTYLPTYLPTHLASTTIAKSQRCPLFINWLSNLRNYYYYPRWTTNKKFLGAAPKKTSHWNKHSHTHFLSLSLSLSLSLTYSLTHSLLKLFHLQRQGR